jgi:hypothetical protein
MDMLLEVINSDVRYAIEQLNAVCLTQLPATDRDRIHRALDALQRIREASAEECPFDAD